MPQDDLFSMEKYATGFVEACAQLGVDPVELVKAAQQLTPEQQQYGRAYRPGVQEQFRYSGEMNKARQWEQLHGTPAREGMFARKALGQAFSLSGTGDFHRPLLNLSAGVAGSKPVQFVKGFFGGGDDRRAAPAPAPAVNPDQERYKREAKLKPFGGGDVYDRMQRAREQFGGQYDARIFSRTRPWYMNTPPVAPESIRRPPLPFAAPGSSR